MHELDRKLPRGSHRGFVVAALTAAVLIVAAMPSPALGQSNKPSDAPLPSCLDQSIRNELGDTLRPRGVQKRDFFKNKRIEITARAGVFAADLLSSSYMAGGAVTMFLTEDLGVELSFDASPMGLDLDKPLAEFFGDERFAPATGYLALANLVWSPVHAKLKMGDSIVHADVLFISGAGRLFHDSVQGVTFDVGLALELYLSKWVTLRFDVRDVIAIQEAVAETRLTNNIAATAGVAFWIPTGL